MKENNNKTKWLHVRLSEDEHTAINKQFKKTTCRKLSDYARKILLGKPVVSTHRNQSLDDFMAELIRLRNDLNAIGNNFNQAVRKLHTIDDAAMIKPWITITEIGRERLQKSVEAIELSIGKMADQWLQ